MTTHTTQAPSLFEQMVKPALQKLLKVKTEFRALDL
jgi:hypothetical protein